MMLELCTWTLDNKSKYRDISPNCYPVIVIYRDTKMSRYTYPNGKLSSSWGWLFRSSYVPRAFVVRSLYGGIRSYTFLVRYSYGNVRSSYVPRTFVVRSSCVPYTVVYVRVRYSYVEDPIARDLRGTRDRFCHRKDDILRFFYVPYTFVVRSSYVPQCDQALKDNLN